MTYEKCLEILKINYFLPVNVYGRKYTIYGERFTLVDETLYLYHAGFTIASVNLDSIKSVKISQGKLITVLTK